MPVRIMDLNTPQCNALTAAGADIVVSVDSETKTAILNGNVSEAITAIQAKCDAIREKDGAKAQNYRSLVGVRNRLEAERELAEKAKSKTVEIIPNGTNIESDVPKVLDGLTNRDKGANGGESAPSLTTEMRRNFAHLANNANTPAAREYWQTKLDALPEGEPSVLFA